MQCLHDIGILLHGKDRCTGIVTGMRCIEADALNACFGYFFEQSGKAIFHAQIFAIGIDVLA